MAEPAKISSVPWPDGATIEVVYVRLPGGRIVVRTPAELVKRPEPPTPPR